MRSTTFSKRYNIDGLFTFSSFRGKERSHSYVQFYRNGIIEAVNTLLLWSRNNDKFIPITNIERTLIEYIPKYIEVYKKFNLDTSIFLFLTLIDAKDYIISENGKWWFDKIFPIDRGIVLIPEIVIEKYDFDPPQLLKPILDSVWNACGCERSLGKNLYI